MDETRRENYGKYVFILLELLSLIAGFICLYKTNMDSKMLLCILPFGFFVISFLFNKNYVYITDDISKLLIIALFFVRLVVLPFLYSANTGAQLFEGRNSVEAYFNKACILMVYEFLIVQAVLYFYDFKKEKQSTFAKNDSRIDITKALIVCLAIYVLGIAIFLPGYAENFKTKQQKKLRGHYHFCKYEAE